jgi:NADPH:quinone reductase-like Zn-dependent oxidoreductase
VKTAKIGPGSRVLIHAAAGGVGHLAVQLAKARGAYVVGTASARNEAYVRSLGADQVIDYTQTDFFEAVDNLDVVLDGVGGTVAFTSVLVLKKGGMLLSLPSPLPASITRIAACNHIQTPWVLVASNGEDMQALADLMEAGMLSVHVSGVYPFQEVGKAHQQVQSARTRGKVVLTLP